MDEADGLAAVPLPLGECAAHASVEGLDGSVEDAAGGVQVAGAEGIGIAGQAGARERQPMAA